MVCPGQVVKSTYVVTLAVSNWLFKHLFFNSSVYEFIKKPIFPDFRDNSLEEHSLKFGGLGQGRFPAGFVDSYTKRALVYCVVIILFDPFDPNSYSWVHPWNGEIQSLGDCFF